MTTLTIPKDPQERFNLFFKSAIESKKIWLLIDEYGSVMLNTDDEECVPVWPSDEHALQWATGEWEGFTAEPISIAKWKSRWTRGLEEDELSLVVYPDQDGEGIILYPDEFEFELVKRENKARR
ncbi:hypothetical protein JCM19231_4247 [Vibrio ishigakensis]|uniref:DUF2750 domain-containing protein n=1 Tax=Vibrio ishigakensis TaxID=1481914 RepID=A0A0B8NVL8_9VIBR|nr:DUF2750 domain-containing protein [Vibrio ishigakensis]GAM58575.1 hypothetical protein JCM19231_4247 [Vibrio ishigakensis]